MVQYDLPAKKARIELKAPVQPPMTQPPVPRPASGDPRGLAPFILETAKKYGIDPATALRVAKSEGLGNFQSGVFKNGVQEPSFGAFQLYTGGGLGNEFQKETGLDPSDPKNEKATIEYALQKASQGGWGPWNGAKNTGIGQFEGIGAGPGGAGTTTDFYSGDPVPDYSTAKSDTAKADDDTDQKKEKTTSQKYGEAAGEGLENVGKAYTAGAKNVTDASRQMSIPTPQPMPAGIFPTVDPKVADAQRQQLAMALQRLNSRRLA
jgi:hypothetical protein